ncbi:FadR/GntR family transcriptional regulator [Humidisolicoccus flavus]|uniref:FadR/GntR family transcriptional regulator n=1 Tax=Humidisolicoccus flavus TaxID=3111414 RepID=UPI00324ADF79
MVRQTLQDDLVETLGLRVIDGTYPAEAVLRTEDIEVEFDISRTVVREALKVLESMGLISARRRVGITVQAASSWHLFDPRVIRWRLAGDGRAEQIASLTELRHAIEPIAARNAALNASEAQQAALLELAEHLDRTGEAGALGTFLEHDIAFHSLLLEASGNEMFSELSAVIAEVLTGRTRYDMMPEHPLPLARQMHWLAAKSIAERNPDAAEDAIRTLLREVRGSVAGAVRSTPPR